MKSKWELKPLGLIAENLDSRRIPITKNVRDTGQYPYYGASGIVDYVGDFIFDEDLLLVSEDGANLLARTYPIAFSISGKTWVNNHAHVLRFEKIVTQKIVEYFLNSISLADYVSGMAQPKLNQKMLNSILVPFPPLTEQKRIVTILDEAFEGIADATANAEKNLRNARELFERYLHAVFTEQGNGWLVRNLGDLATFRNGINFTKSSKGAAVRIVGVKDFQKHFYAPVDDLDSVITEGKLPESDFLSQNDILFVRSNGNLELIGRSILIGELSEKTTFSGFTIRARLNDESIYPEYLCHYLKSGVARRTMIDGGNGVNIKSLNQTTLSELAIPLPPSVKEQKAVVSHLESLSTDVQRLESVYQQKLDALAELKKSILHQAFTGQLH